MNITEYRQKNGISVINMSKLLNITRQHVYEIESGKSYPSRKLALRIERVTNGDVTAKEVMFL